MPALRTLLTNPPSPKKLFNFTLVIAVAGLGLLAYVWLFDIEPRDVYAYHDFDTTIDPRAPLRPGDIVEIDDQDEIRVICRLKGAAPLPGDIAEAIYFNRYYERVQEYGDWMLNGFAGDASASDTDAPSGSRGRELSFSGNRLVPEGLLQDFTEFDKDDCDERMADVLLNGSSACTVARSIVEVKADNSGTLHRVVALKFQSHSNVPEGVLRQRTGTGDVPLLTQAEINAFYERPCARNTLPLEVRVRDALNAIGVRS